MSAISDDEDDGDKTTLAEILIIPAMWCITALMFAWGFVSEPFRKK